MDFSTFQKALFAVSSEDVFLHNSSSKSRSDSLWDSEHARFRSWALPYITSVPLIVTFLSILSYVIRLCLPRTPLWMSNFVSETKSEAKPPGLQSIPRNRHLLLTTVTSIAGFCVHCVTWSRAPESLPLTFVGLSWVCATAVGLIFRFKVFSWTILLLFVSIFLAELNPFVGRERPLSASDIPNVFELLFAFCGALLTVSMPLRPPDWSKEGISQFMQPPDPMLRSPEDDFTAWQWMSVSWLRPLLEVGKKRQLNEDDVWSLGLEFHHKRLHNAFRDLCGSVLRRLLLANGLDLFITSILGVIEALADLSTPVILQQLLRSLQNPDAPRGAAITYASMSLVAGLISSQAGVFSLWFCRRCYERSRGEMITMLYEKTLSRKIVGEGVEEANGAKRNADDASGTNEGQEVITTGQTRLRWYSKLFKRKSKATIGVSETKKPATMGKILNLMRNDVYEVSQRFWEFRDLVITPVQVIISVILVWVILGWPCLIGITTVLFTQILNIFLARIQVSWEKKRRAATDKKLQIISQFIEAIRHLRWYGWQGAWLEQVIQRRQEELNVLIFTRIWRLAISTSTQFGSALFPVLAFYAYTVTFDMPLTIDVAFPALQIFLTLMGSMRKIPDLITMALNASVALQRIEAFMDEPDKDVPKQVASLERQPDLESASFAWPGSGETVLRDVSLCFPKGMTVIGGKVGSGKTALLLSLLGELDLINGVYQRSSDLVGYCEQRPWLQSMTIRDNILFHKPYDDSRYKQVLDACALTPDLAGFQAGDLSFIGENGIGLSGGQRARVALARAIYSDAKILYLDDPLSALDHQTAESIVIKCFNGPLIADRTVILVTHRLDICRGVATQYVEIIDGKTHVRAVSDLPTYAAEPADTSLHAGQGEEEGDGDGDEATTKAQMESAIPDKFMEEEHRAHGGIEYSIYWEYVKAGRYRWWVAVLIAFSAMRLFSIGKTWFLKVWGEAYDRGDIESDGLDNFFGDWTSPAIDARPWILAYFVLQMVHTLATIIARGFMFVIIYSAGRKMFKDVVQHVAYAKFRFYDVTPIGRLMNRMTSDISTIDGDISRQFFDLSLWGIVWVSSMVVIASVTPLFLVFAIFMTMAFVVVFLQFLPTSQSLRRLEMTSLSPLLSDFGALLDGLTTVRAFRMQSRFQDRVIAVTDNFQRMDHFYWSAQAWLMYRFNNISSISTFLLTVIGIFSNISAGLIAFALTTAAQFVYATHQLCEGYGKLQMDFVSVERVVELIRLEQEPKGDFDPPASWPRFNGDIEFKDVKIRYAPNLDPALSEVSFTIKGGSTTAVIGRTGSGKSTLAASLLATVIPETGSIIIDGVDVSKVNKQTLRSRLTFLAQDPVLFPGSLRQNLDPINEHTDEDCERVLQKVCGAYQWSLETHVEGGGRNFSQGQRQLIGLARAILRRSAIVILDEATASIDIATSMKIQEVLREEMRESTVITIAHRVEAVKDADSVLVLDKGRVSDHRSVTASS